MKTNKRQKYNGQYCVPDVVSFSGLSIVFLCFVCLHPVNCVPDVLSFSGLSIVFLSQHREHNTQDEDKQKTKIQWTIQRNLQHREHNSHDEDKQKTKIQVCLHPVYCVPNVVSFSGLSIVFLCFVCLHHVNCVPDVLSFSGLSIVFLSFVCLQTQKYNTES
jgi:hypothetical protein